MERKYERKGGSLEKKRGEKKENRKKTKNKIMSQLILSLDGKEKKNKDSIEGIQDKGKEAD